jgi:hypothetical protein
MSLLDSFTDLVNEVGINIAISLKYGVTSETAIKINKIKNNVFFNEDAKKIAIQALADEERLNRQILECD